jgi:kynureninase
MIENALARGFRVNSPMDSAKRGGSVIVDVPSSEAVKAELIARRFIVDHRPKAGIRIAPHFYTTDEECDAVIEEISTIIESRAFERHLGAARAAH